MFCVSPQQKIALTYKALPCYGEAIAVSPLAPTEGY